jgi:hypothetical protein
VVTATSALLTFSSVAEGCGEFSAERMVVVLAAGKRISRIYALWVTMTTYLSEFNMGQVQVSTL